MKNPLDHAPGPLLATKVGEIMSEGNPQTPGNPDGSGLHTPYFIILPMAVIGPGSTSGDREDAIEGNS